MSEGFSLSVVVRRQKASHMDVRWATKSERMSLSALMVLSWTALGSLLPLACSPSLGPALSDWSCPLKMGASWLISKKNPYASSSFDQQMIKDPMYTKICNKTVVSNKGQ